MNFKELVFNIVFVIWLALITVITANNYITVSKLGIRQSNDAKVLVKAVNSLAKRLPVTITDVQK